MDFVSWWKKYWLSVLFEAGAYTLSVFVGLALNVDWEYIVFAMITFILPRMTMRNLKIGIPKHYKRWYFCLLWSILIFISLFFVVKTSLPLALVSAGFCAIILSSIADVEDGLQYKKFDYSALTKKEIAYYMEECNFTDEETQYFKLRAAFHKSHVETYIAMSVSESKATRISNKVIEKIVKAK